MQPTRLSGPAFVIPQFKFGTTAVLPAPLFAAGGAKMPDGRMVAVGGQVSILDDTPTDITYVFAADGKSYVTAGDFPVALIRPLATHLSDGRVLGIANDASNTTVATLDPVTLNWTSRTSMSAPFPGCALVTLPNGNALRIGGGSGSGTTTVEEFNRITNAWVAKASMTYARSKVYAVVCSDGTVLISDNDGGGDPIEVYNPVANTWSTTTNSPGTDNVGQVRAPLPDGRLLFATNVTSSPDFTYRTDIYNPVTKAFTPQPDGPNQHGLYTYAYSQAGFSIGDGLVAIHNVRGPLQGYDYGKVDTAFFDYRHRVWYGGTPSYFSSPSQISHDNLIFHLDQSKFLILGQTLPTVAPYPHNPGWYANLSIEALNSGTAPTFAGITRVEQGSKPNSVLVSWDAASHSKTATEDIVYSVYVANSSGGQDFNAPAGDTQIWAGALSKEIDTLDGLTPLVAGNTYYFVVRAKSVLATFVLGNSDTNTVELDFTPDVVATTTEWATAPNLSIARKNPLGSRMADGRFIIFGGYDTSNNLITTADIYSQNGSVAVESVGYPVALGSAIDAEPPASDIGILGGVISNTTGGRHRTTVIGGLNGSGVSEDVKKRYPYVDTTWSNVIAADLSSSPQPLGTATYRHTTIALPESNILKIGGLTVSGDTTSTTAIVEKMTFGTPEIVYDTLANGPFVAGQWIKGNTSLAKALIVSDDGVDQMNFQRITPARFIDSETISVFNWALTNFGTNNAALTITRPSNDTAFNFAGDFTITFNAKRNNSSVAILIEKYDYATDGGWSFYFNGTEIQCYLYGSVVLTTTGGLFTSGTVHGIGFRRVGTTYSIWIDGAENVSATNAVSVTTTTNPLLLGRREAADPGGPFHFNGQFDNLGIWSTALSDTDIGDVTDGTIRPAAATGTLQGNWAFNRTLADSSGNSRDFSSAITPFWVEGTSYSPVTTARLYSVEVNSINQTWANAASLNTARRDHSSILLDDGRVLVVGGLNSAGTAISNAEIWDPIANTWSVISSGVGVHHKFPMVKLANGKVLCIGGGSTTLDIFDPVANTFSAGAVLDQSKTEHTAHLYLDGQVGVFGGRNSGTATSDVRLYDPTGNAWTSGNSLITARAGHASFLMANNQVLVLGGENNAGTAIANAERSIYLPPSSLLTGLISYYTLDGDGTDYTGNNPMTVTGVTFGSGSTVAKINQGVTGFGSGTSPMVPAGSTLDIVSDMTIACWVYPLNRADYYSIVCHIISSGGPSTNYHLIMFPGGVIHLFSAADSGIASSSPIPASDWTHIVATRTTAGFIEIYINGILSNSGSGNPPLTLPTADTYLGWRPDNYSSFPGGIDEVGFWSRVLTSTEVTALYNAGTGIQPPF